MKLACLRCKRKKVRLLAFAPIVVIVGKVPGTWCLQTTIVYILNSNRPSQYKSLDTDVLKVKCDKAEPICHQCVTAKTECQYVERRQRPRLAQQRVAVNSLNQRLEVLERQIVNGGYCDEPQSLAPSRSPSSSLSLPTSTDTADQDNTAHSSPSLQLRLNESSEDSWIYRLASDAKRQFQTQATPISTPTPQIDTDMSALNEALEDLAKLRLRSDLTHPKVSLKIAPGEARQCIEAFIEMMNTLVVPDIFAIALDIELLRSLPNIIGSPYINVDAGVHVMYYSAIHYGLCHIRGPGHAQTQAAYLKALEHVPAWLDTPTETDMDGYTAAMAAWVAINNLDYQLSWKFHCKACHWVKSRGIDKMDVTPAMTLEEERKRESIRYLYYHILSTDCLFRLFYNKPTILRWDPEKVKPPSVMTSRNLHPSPTQVMISCVWTSYTARSVEVVSYIDSADCKGTEMFSKVEDCCKNMEALVSDWRMEAVLADTTIRLPLRCLVADHVMNIYANIVGLKRLANRVGNVTTVDEMTVRAARKVVGTLLEFDQEGGLADRSKPDPVDYVCHFILFYPFCAVFTLYEYIIACTNPDECEEDVRQLEHIADAMEHTSQTIRPDLKPFAKTIKALNKVSRTMQDSRRKRPLSADGHSANISGGQTQPENFHTIAMSDLDPSAFDTFPDFPMTTDGDPDPLGFVRAMENDFIGRNWHENWWDMGGSLENGMNYMPPNT